MKDNFVFGLDINERFIAISRSSERDGVRMPDLVRSVSVSELSREERVSALKGLVDSYQLSADNTAVLFPRSEVLIKYLNIPAANHQELRNMLEMQLLKESPFPREQVYVAWQATGKDQNKIRVLVNIIKKERLDAIISLCAAAGITPRFMVFASSALRCFLPAETSRGDTADLFVDLDETFAELAVFDSAGENLFGRKVSVSLTDRAVMLREIRQTAAYYAAKKMGPPIGRVVLAGSPAGVEVLKQVLHKELSVPVIPVSILEKFPGIQRETPQEASVSAVTGLSLIDFTSDRLNVLPEELRSRNQTNRLRRLTSIAAALVAGSMLIMNLQAMVNVKAEKARLSMLDVAVRQAAPELKMIKEVQPGIELVRKQRERALRGMDSFCETYSLLPASLNLSLFEYSADKGVTVQGSAYSMNDIFTAVSRLQKPGLFGKVELKYATKHKVEKAELIDFEIGAVYAD